MSFTKDNHFKFGYDHRWFVPRNNPEQRYTVLFDHCQREPLSWRDECIEAARLIGQGTDDPIHVLYSGGIDSEVTVMSFLEAGVSITADIMCFEDDLNQHDVRYAFEFCRSHNVPFKVHNLNIRKFFAGQMYDYADVTHCASPQLCATMWLVDQIDGYPVIGQGECVLVLKDDRWVFRESEMVNSFYRYYMVTDREGIPGFHQYTPEQMLSFFKDTTFLPYMNLTSGKTSNKTTKPEIYQKYFPIEPRPKYTGFEKVMDLDRIHRDKLMQMYNAWTDNCIFDFDTILAILAPIPFQ